MIASTDYIVVGGTGVLFAELGILVACSLSGFDKGKLDAISSDGCPVDSGLVTRDIDALRLGSCREGCISDGACKSRGGDECWKEK